MNQIANSRFKFFPQLNDLEETRWMSSENTIFLKLTDRFFSSQRLQDVFLRAVAAERLLPIKEVLETFEMFARVRRQSRSSAMADLCCGHGLLGILFAMFERNVERVLLIDRKLPDCHHRLVEIAHRVAPWVAQKLDCREVKILRNDAWIEPQLSVVSAHACGVLSDLCIDIAIDCGGSIAIMPCCYPKAACAAPLALQTTLGLPTAFDIDRTYRLEAAGYHVRWATIPSEITPMNRIIYGRTK